MERQRGVLRGSIPAAKYLSFLTDVLACLLPGVPKILYPSL